VESDQAGSGAAQPALRAEPALSLPTSSNRSIDLGGLSVLEDPAEGAAGAPRLECPNANGLVLISQSTGNVLPLRCRRNTCPVCVLINARRRALAIAGSRPERAILLTRAGESWDILRARVNRVGYDIRQLVGPEFQWVWHAEPNPSGDGQHHVHAWTHGAYVDHAKLSEIADSRGFGEFARINRVKSTAGAAAYGLKGLGYGLKNVNSGEGAEYLRANGRRLTHQSRGYFRTAEGESIPVKRAEQLAVAGAGDGDPGPWILTTL
jgi:hypothetical protein